MTDHLKSPNSKTEKFKMPTEPQDLAALTSEQQRQLRALLYLLTPMQMLEVVMEVIQRQQLNTPKTRKRIRR